MELLKSNDFNYSFHIELSKREVVELLYFFFYKSTWINKASHEHVYDFIWKLKVEMDNIYPNWHPEDLRKLHKEFEGETNE